MVRRKFGKYSSLNCMDICWTLFFSLYRMTSLSFGRWGNFTVYPGVNVGNKKKCVSGPLSESVGVCPEGHILGWR